MLVLSAKLFPPAYAVVAEAFAGEEEVLFLPNPQFLVESVLASDADKKAALEQLAAYDMAELDVYFLKQVA